MKKSRAKNTTVKAFIEFLPWSESEGRRTSVDCTLRSYRPDHQFSWMKENVMYMGQVAFPEARRTISPGESSEATVSFCSYPELDEKLEPGLKWRVKEGDRTVAHATLLEIIKI